MPKVTSQPTLIGCELLVRKDNSILLGLRKNIYGDGTWALPGGHLEFGEKLGEAVRREAHEELGADIPADQLQLISIVDDVQPDTHLHYVHISFEVQNPSWEPRLMEPDECAEWRYFPLSDLPKNLFIPHKPIIHNYLRKQLYLS